MNQPNKFFTLNNEQDEGTVILPDCRLYIKYRAGDHQDPIKIRCPPSSPLSSSYTEKLNRASQKPNRENATIARIQRDLLELLLQMPAMRDSSIRMKLLPAEFQRRGSWEYAGDLDTDLKSIIDKNNSLDSLHNAIDTAMDFALSNAERIQLSRLSHEMKTIKPAQEKRRGEIIFGSNDHRSRLLNNLDKHFSMDELKTLCFHLDIDPENLGATRRHGLARELIKDIERTGRIPELFVYCKKFRPNVDWPSPSYWEL